MSNYSESDEMGDIGIDLVSLKVRKEFSWIFREQQKSDLGIDGHIEVVNENREGTGRLIAVQIKTGDSYFKNNKDNGYVFYGDNKHLKYWLLHSLPVIIILCDARSEVCYWEEVTRTNIDNTPHGWKITIPNSQVINHDSKEKLSLIAGMPQHSDIVELALFKFLSEKYHKYSNFGRLDICPLMYEPHDFMYLTCMGEFEKTSEFVYIAHHYDIYEDFSEIHLDKFIKWRELNILSCGHSGLKPRLFIFVISDDIKKLVLAEAIIKKINNNSGVEVFRLLYAYFYMGVTSNRKIYSLTELDENNEQICMY